ncbi:MAG: 2,3,4,5-tetrahydropyridine-2,6-dicarboxylate N-succinyltransferase [Acidimicrobiales bacterium]
MSEGTQRSGGGAADAPGLGTAPIEDVISKLWEERDELVASDARAMISVRHAITLLDSGQARVAEVDQASGEVRVNAWLMQAILLLFKISQVETTELGPFEYVDKIPLKSGFGPAGVRVVPGASARWGSYLEPGVVLMPSYVNIGARVGANTMVDTWATIGSCAQVGANVHISGGVGIGGVLEPPGARPVVVEDEAMIGSRSMITQGARVGRGAVVGEGVILNPSIPVIDVETGAELSRGVVPPWSVAVGGMRLRSFPGGDFGLPCVLVIRRLAEGQRHDKARLNELLRDEGYSM